MSHPSARKATAVLIGADGMLGRAMAAELAARQWECIAPTLEQLDLSKPHTIRRFFDWTRDRRAYGPPNFIINCAAWTDVDRAEQHEAEATAINADAIAELVSHCTMDTSLLTFSTDYVFDGASTNPYPTDHPRAPLNAYGRSKAAGEAVLDERPRHDWLNIRTSWLYAPWGNNFVLTMRKLLFERPELRIVNDQRGRPTSAQHLARASLTLLDSGVRGHHHITDGGECTWYEFTCEIKRLLAEAPHATGRAAFQAARETTNQPTGSAAFQAAGETTNQPTGRAAFQAAREMTNQPTGRAAFQAAHLATVLPCTSADFPRPAKRPAYSVLDITRTEAILGPMPHWKQNLAQVLSQLPP